MDAITLIATSTFGLERVVKREVQALGFDDLHVSQGRVEFDAAPDDIAKANLWLRCADRVLLKMGEFKAHTFDQLYEQCKALPWEKWISKTGRFTVIGKSVKSTLSSVRACQSIVKKAVVDRLQASYQVEWFEETGPEFTIQVALFKDMALLTIDTSGSGLNRRGYRKQTSQAAIKETLAASLVQLSFWNKNRLLVDPMCGSGTILIEAAMIARNMAPGLKREFAAEKWPALDPAVWRRARQAAYRAIDRDCELNIEGYDIDPECVSASKVNAKSAGVGKDIEFKVQDVKDWWIDRQYGILISNPPYGQRIGRLQELNKIYVSLNKTFRKKSGWSVYILTADRKFPDYFKRSRPDRVRRLYNGSIEVNYYQYFGDRPPKQNA